MDFLIFILKVNIMILILKLKQDNKKLPLHLIQFPSFKIFFLFFKLNQF